MNGYSCKACGALAAVSPEGAISRSCGCGVGIIAGMSAVAYGEGRVEAQNRGLGGFVRWFVALLAARPAK